MDRFGGDDAGTVEFAYGQAGAAGPDLAGQTRRFRGSQQPADSHRSGAVVTSCLHGLQEVVKRGRLGLGELPVEQTRHGGLFVVRHVWGQDRAARAGPAGCGGAAP
ncbi:hypothetical protein, partial [Streptomyces goshikiensis]|uniref:hypothetical protein n=1 Tax=Streptomyces goshikiensis TaxID=1942 RepID=UPI003651567A